MSVGSAQEPSLVQNQRPVRLAELLQDVVPQITNPGDIRARAAQQSLHAIRTSSPTCSVAAGPVALADRCIRLGCPPGAVVLDPFSGSSTTGIAARATGCAFIGIDLDPASHVIARRRLAEQQEFAA